jgi:hypothetical protein
MPTWEVSTDHTHQAGEAAKTVGAWRAAYSAALEIALARVPAQLQLKVDDEQATIRPSTTHSELISLPVPHRCTNRRKTGEKR